MKEGEATRKLKRALEEHPRLKGRALVQRHVNTFYTSGVPDLSVSVGAFTLWLELKMHGEKTTKLQAYNLDRLGIGAAVVTFSKDGREAIMSNIALAGFLNFTELVEEIVSQCLENDYAINKAVTRGLSWIQLVSAGKVKP